MRQAQVDKFMKTSAEAANDNARSYKAEQVRGHAILQRRRRLLELQTPPESDADGKPPSYFNSLSEDQSRKLQAEILHLTELYWDSNGIITSKIERWDLSNPFLATLKRARVWTDKHGRPWMWSVGRNDCADNGGCCGRDCGCCEKALFSYIRTSENDMEERKEVGVYGHCTEECPCCIRVHGRYHPHPRLPQSEF
ncbi:predicted protein [Aspergillus terreus NIH2624]|uniref:Uncharacterized protein n=1 Tax=Aspergillus terreus (strain NIH 2624 / FGSC A1156) TaxID=341663 RepID=Q0C8Z4_ASPTN|nr:uncharacterized protein ATEG_09840 [Aspergillus terreus NIH2624]EAU30031.1 predicted protein [Aspergillus terreus NIH2624]